MASIFNFNDDDDGNGKINIDELYEKKHQDDLNRLSTYKKVLSKIHNKISSELKKEWRDVDDPNLFKKILRSKKDFKEKMASYPSKSNVKTGDKS